MKPVIWRAAGVCDGENDDHFSDQFKNDKILEYTHPRATKFIGFSSSFYSWKALRSLFNGQEGFSEVGNEPPS